MDQMMDSIPQMDLRFDPTLINPAVAHPGIVVENLFGILAPGRSVQTAFSQTSETKFVINLENPMEIPDLVFFLLPNAPLPEGYGAILYYCKYGDSNWDILGAVTHEKSSGVFRTGWQGNEQFVGIPAVQVGVSIESVDVIQNLGIETSGVDERKQFAHKVAVDLFNYMGSFNQSTSQMGDVMVIPTNILDCWMQRFEQKYNRDPNFMMKDNH